MGKLRLERTVVFWNTTHASLASTGNQQTHAVTYVRDLLAASVSLALGQVM